ncbi:MULTISPECIES: hypothetical protein [unclassified Plantibacter]|uniref:hypothetical protein n=1 Tax=unclassified Plantibacter TaxID=2624265 RepID=UPI0018D7B00F|nr:MULTISPECIES: hypothetical protein [unclassified Plantibacter]
MKNPFRRDGSPNDDSPNDDSPVDEQIDAPEQPNQGRTLEPAPEVLTELDALNEACRAAPDDIDAQIRLWRAVAALDRWVFINRGPEDNPRPYALAAQPGNLIGIYSSGTRAQEAAYANGLVPPDATVSLLAVPMPAAIDWVRSFGEHGVVGVTIDYPRLGAWCPLQNLAGLKPTDSQG